MRPARPNATKTATAWWNRRLRLPVEQRIACPAVSGRRLHRRLVDLQELQLAGRAVQEHERGRPRRDAHVEGEKLVPDTAAARSLIKKLGSTPVHTYGDRFSAKPAPRAKVAGKTTPAKPRARREPAQKIAPTRGRK